MGRYVDGYKKGKKTLLMSKLVIKHLLVLLLVCACGGEEQTQMIMDTTNVTGFGVLLPNDEQDSYVWQNGDVVYLCKTNDTRFLGENYKFTFERIDEKNKVAWFNLSGTAKPTAGKYIVIHTRSTVVLPDRLTATDIVCNPPNGCISNVLKQTLDGMLFKGELSLSDGVQAVDEAVSLACESSVVNYSVTSSDKSIQGGKLQKVIVNSNSTPHFYTGIHVNSHGDVSDAESDNVFVVLPSSEESVVIGSSTPVYVNMLILKSDAISDYNIDFIIQGDDYKYEQTISRSTRDFTSCDMISIDIDNPQISGSFVPGEPWLDVDGEVINAHDTGILYYEGTYYMHGVHRVAGSAGNKCQVGVRCYSSKDLYHWKNEGIVLPVAPEGSGSDIEKGCILEVPKVIYCAQTQKFVMWFHLERKGQEELYSGALTGVAVSDSPTGPFTYIRALRPNAGVYPLNINNTKKPIGPPGSKPGQPPHAPSTSRKHFDRDFEGGQQSRAMNLFVDDDGKAYHVHASESNMVMHISLLTDDYLDFTDQYTRVFVWRQTEAPIIFKHNGTYFFIGSGCTGWDPNAARSARTNDILGEWEELGNPCVGDGADITFSSQGRYVLPVPGKKNGSFIFIADRHVPKNPIDSRYVWLPIDVSSGIPKIRWYDEWNLSIFDN